jgi:hypothetical protein
MADWGRREGRRTRKTNPTAKNTSYTIARFWSRCFCMYARIEKAATRTAAQQTYHLLIRKAPAASTGSMYTSMDKIG